MADNRSHSLGDLDELLASLDEAGVSLDLGFAPGPLREQLHQVADMPASYCQLLAQWSAGEDPARALDRVLVPAQEHSDYGRRMTTGLAYPGLIATFACFIAAVMGYTLLPLFESTYEQLHEPVGPAVARLQILRTLTPLWLVAVPLGIACGVRWVKQSDRRKPSHAQMRATRLAEWAQRSGSDDDRRAVAELESNRAHRRVWRRTIYWPLIALVIVGGGATLLVGLALFEPMIELLYRLAA